MNIARRIILFITSLFKMQIQRKHTMHQHNVSQPTAQHSNPSVRDINEEEEKVEAFISTFIPDFIQIACAHYNAQYEYNAITDFYKAKMYDLELATNYFIRNRCRLLEWYCLHNGNRRLFDDEDMILYDINNFDAKNKAFDIAFKNKANKLGIKLKLDTNHKCGMPMLNDDGTTNWKAIACLQRQLKDNSLIHI